MDKYLNEIRNNKNSEKALQLINAVTSVLNVFSEPNQTSAYQQKSIEVCFLVYFVAGVLGRLAVMSQLLI